MEGGGSDPLPPPPCVWAWVYQQLWDYSRNGQMVRMTLALRRIRCWMASNLFQLVTGWLSGCDRAIRDCHEIANFWFELNTNQNIVLKVRSAKSYKQNLTLTQSFHCDLNNIPCAILIMIYKQYNSVLPSHYCIFRFKDDQQAEVLYDIKATQNLTIKIKETKP